MKAENGYNELVLGNKDNTSSHYRIKSDGLKVQLLTIMEGYRKCDQNEFFMCQIGFRHEFIVAKIDGNMGVKLFTLKNFMKWEYEERHVPYLEMPLNEYNNSTSFMKVVERLFLALNPQIQTA